MWSALTRKCVKFCRLRLGLKPVIDYAQSRAGLIGVEGFDMEVIRGGTDVMRRASAAILEIPLLESPTGQPDFAEFTATMSRLGFMYRGNLSQAYVEGVPKLVDAVFIRPRQAQRAAA